MAAPQPVPPVWKDVGKSSNDLLSKDFPIDKQSIEVKTRTPSNVTFRVFGEQHSKKPDVINADIEAKYQDKASGITFTQSWTTLNALKTLVELDDKVAKGVKLELASSLTPAPPGSEKAVTAKSTLLTATWKQPGVHTRAVLDLFKGPTFTADTVLGRDGFLVGLEGSYNVSEGRITRYATALGFSAPEYAVTLHGLGNLSTFSASYYHRVSPDVEAGAKAVWDSKAHSSAVSLEVAAKAYIDKAAFVKARINNAGILSLAYTQNLRPGVKASFGLALDTQRLQDPTPAGPAHKVGAAFVFEA
ncbi:voltage-dependent ion-selective channel [Exidia glandulosa HHB12029]|uniref:Voltage-dependent ion-selective channel n=1 Tax=Exidia glandulosa HHB12029 TaxID=1314781 RepID=A0A165P276_EXIGL|nr:voltage-dependent ion-selective channel [Exidia glandulosa HHB12029]